VNQTKNKNNTKAKQTSDPGRGKKHDTQNQSKKKNTEIIIKHYWGANYSSDADLINLITLTKPNVCARAIQQPQKTDDLLRRAKERQEGEKKEKCEPKKKADERKDC
jgi:hypothetical protein